VIFGVFLLDEGALGVYFLDDRVADGWHVEHAEEVLDAVLVRLFDHVVRLDLLVLWLGVFCAADIGGEGEV